MVANAQILDLIAGLHHADLENTDGTVTTTELGRIMGCSRDKALRTIRDLIDAGKLEPERIPRRNIQGEVQHVAGYRVVPDATD